MKGIEAFLKLELNLSLLIIAVELMKLFMFHCSFDEGVKKKALT